MNEHYSHKVIWEQEKHRLPWCLFFKYYKIHDGSKVFFERHLRGEILIDRFCGWLNRFTTPKHHSALSKIRWPGWFN
jgi:hypothetical protein